MSYKNLLFEVKENIGIITINRPDKLNALNYDTLNELKNILTEIKNDNSIYVAIITGAGEKAFIAGADISELNKLNEETGKTFAAFGQEVFNSIEQLGKPVIAAVNGFALGGGCELALACTLRYSSENAKFGQPEVNLGIIPGYGGTQRLARVVNSARALELILTGDIIDANEAYRIGLVNKVFPINELLSKTLETAKKICSKGQKAISSSLQAVQNGFDLSLTEGFKLEAELFASCCGTEDFKEGTSAFLEKRKPNFNNL